METVAGVDAVVREHEASGHRILADGVASFALRSGTGEPVVLMRGAPASSFLYRKVIPELASRGFDALSFDLPGLGLADRSPTSTTASAGWDGSRRRRERDRAGGVSPGGARRRWPRRP